MNQRAIMGYGRWGCMGLLGILALGAAGCGETVIGQRQELSGTLGVDLGKIAVVSGDFEAVEASLSLYGVEFDLYDGYLVTPGGESWVDVEALLGDALALSAYDTLYFNCGSRGTGVIDPHNLLPSTSLIDRGDILENLRDFIDGGGVVYISDQSYGLIEAAIPQLIDFHGVDDHPGDALRGRAGVATGETHRDAPFELTQGLEFEVDLDHQWAAAWPNEHAWVLADVYLEELPNAYTLTPNTPLLMGVPYGAGLVVFSSVHQNPPTNQPMSDLQIDLFRAMGGAR